MSKTNLYLVRKEQAEVIQLASAKLSRNENLTVSRGELIQLLCDANYVSNTLHNVEYLNDLDWQVMTDLCRAACKIVNSLSAIIDRKGDSIK